MTGTSPRYRPLPWQVKPWRDKSKVLLLTGSAGGGKSRLAAEKIVAYCLKYGGAMGLMVRKTRESMTNSTVLFIERTIMADMAGVRHYPSKNRFEFTNGSILAYGGMADEKQREQIRSIGQEGALDIAWMEEANKFREEDYQEVIPRLRGNAAGWRQIILTTNPDAPGHWIYKRLILGEEASTYYSGAQDNPHNPSDYIDSLGLLVGIQALRLRGGQWVQAEGAVYDEFENQIHVTKAPDLTRTIAGVDWGYTNPAVILVIGVDGDGRAYVVEEYYECRKRISQIVQAARELAERWNIETFFCDPSEPANIYEMVAAGLSAAPADNAVNDGIQKVKERLAKAGDGRRRLYFDPSCANTLAELASYRWREGVGGQPRDEPEKVNDHAMDALRYAIMQLDSGIWLIH
jgi:phage terminase large subunit